jgi:hypothetical protein
MCGLSRSSADFGDIRLMVSVRLNDWGAFFCRLDIAFAFASSMRRAPGLVKGDDAKKDATRVGDSSPLSTESSSLMGCFSTLKSFKIKMLTQSAWFQLASQPSARNLASHPNCGKPSEPKLGYHHLVF